MIKTKEIFLTVLCHDFDRRNKVATDKKIVKIQLKYVLLANQKRSINCRIDHTPNARQGRVIFCTCIKLLPPILVYVCNNMSCVLLTKLQITLDLYVRNINSKYS